MRCRLLLITGTSIIAAMVPALAQVPLEAGGASGPAWSPYFAGVGIGLLVIATFYFSGKPLGASGAYAKVAGVLGMQVAPAHTKSLKYFEEEKPNLDWEVFLVAGVILGALLAAATGGEITGQWVPPLWEERFGNGAALRLLIAFLGGTLLAFGARMAGGCTSGHGISGTLQLSVGSWIAVICFFIGGILVANLMYRA